MDDSSRKRHLSETALRLRNAGFHVDNLPDDRLLVSHDESLLCTVENPGGISYRQQDMSDPELLKAKDQAYEIVRQVAEYMRLMDRAPILKVPGLSDQYKSLADFNGTVLAGMESKYGVMFVTWDWDFNYQGLSHGHYYSQNYEGAKQDFATRSGLVQERQIFNAEQLTEIYRCCGDTLNGDFELSNGQEKLIRGLQEQIEDLLPDDARQIAQHSQSMDESQGPELYM